MSKNGNNCTTSNHFSEINLPKEFNNKKTHKNQMNTKLATCTKKKIETLNFTPLASCLKTGTTTIPTQNQYQT